MVSVTLWGSLRAATGGRAEVAVDATDFKQLLDRLVQQYPALKPQIERGVSLALDGRIIRDAWFTEIRPENEVVLMPRMVGG